jgi:tetratricopeptide (TPR) repeat protein
MKIEAEVSNGAGPAPGGPVSARPRADGSRPTRATPAPMRRPAVVVPRQLPAPPSSFVGRVDELDRLSRALPPTGGPDGPDRSMPIMVIHGPGGVGKTWLALRWAHDHLGHFPDGQLYVNLQGFGPAGAVVDPAAALPVFIDALGVAADSVVGGMQAHIGLYRSLLSGRRMLVVLDNAHDVAQVRPLLPGSAGCLVVVTSRNRLSGLVAGDGAHPLGLDLPGLGDARGILARRLGVERVAAEPDAVDEIVRRCARLPLALAVAAARAAEHPGFPLAHLARQLRDTAGSLDAFEAADALIDVRTVFSWSYRALSGDAATLFRCLGLHPGPDITTAAAASLVGLPASRVRRLLAELTQAHLLTEQTPGRFAFHDLLRAYALEQADAEDTGEFRRAAVRRVIDHHLHTAFAAAQLLYPDPNPIDLAPAAPGVVPEHLTDHDRALAWFVAEYAVILAVVDAAASAGTDTATWQLVWVLTRFQFRQGKWHEQTAALRLALEAAERLGDGDALARTRHGLALGCLETGRLDEAEVHYRRAVASYAELGNLVGQAHARSGLADIAERQGRHGDALRHTHESLALYQSLAQHHAADDPAWQAGALNNLGWRCVRLGDHRQAIAHSEQALTLLRSLDKRDSEARTWDTLGHAYRGLAEYDTAVTCQQRALDLFRQLGYRYWEAYALASLGDTHHAAGAAGAARAAWEQAVHIFDELGHPDAGRIRENQAGLEPAAPPDVSVAADTDTDTDTAAGGLRHALPPLSCRRHGRGWLLESGPRTAVIPHSAGLLHLAVLVANPNREIPAIELATGVATLQSGAAAASDEPVLDRTAIDDYRRRLEQIATEVAGHESAGRADRAATARAEYDWLVAELARATAIGGRTRAFPSNQERARTAVSRAIRRSIRTITQIDAQIGEHLSASVLTGARCSYRPI